MSRNLLRRIAAALVSVSLCASCFAPAPAAYADTSDPLQWAAWIGESLSNAASDLLSGLGNPAGLPGLAAWSVAYGSSAGMAQAVRDLPEYQALYGFNPLDKSTIIRSYDGGEQMSVLNADGLYNAYLWIHGGIPPEGESSGGSGGGSDVSDSKITWIVTDSISESMTFPNGKPCTFSAASVEYYNAHSSQGVVYAISPDSSDVNVINFNGVIALSSTRSFGPCSNFAGFSITTPYYNPFYESTAGFCSALFTSNAEYYDTTRNGDFYSWTRTPSVAPSYLPTPYHQAIASGATSLAPTTRIYLVTNAPVYVYDNEQPTGPAPEPEPVPPVGPSEPDIQNPDVTEPSSDTPIQNTTVNVTVTLPDGSTTVVQAPTADLSPIVHWLSIINANLVAWSSSIKDSIDGWGGNISAWLAEIWKTLDAFRLAVDNWSVSILTALDQLGGLWPTGGEDSTNFWNNVVLVNNNVWGSAPSSADVGIVSNDLERLKTKFPFSVPWDLLAILLLFDADPVTPSFSVPLVYFDGSTRTQALDVDLEPFDSTMATWRRLVFIAFAAALALKSKDLLAYCNDTFDWF